MRLTGAEDLNRRLGVMASPAASRQLMTKLGADTMAKAKQKLRQHRKTGLTSGSGKLEVQDRSFRVSFGRGAIFLERGTRPHRIVARRAKALRFVGGFGRATGQARLSGTARRSATDIVFAKGVNHPGTDAEPFLEPAAVETLRAADIDPIVKAWNDAA